MRNRVINRLTPVFFALLLVAVNLPAASLPPLTSLTLAWNKSISANVTYILRWGPTPGATNFSMSVGTNLTATVTNLTAGFVYFHVVSKTSSGIESMSSNMLGTTNYPAAPLQLRITTNTSAGLRLEGTVDGSIWFPLANITNGPVSLAMRQRMMFRTPTNMPPLPTTLRAP